MTPTVSHAACWALIGNFRCETATKSSTTICRSRTISSPGTVRISDVTVYNPGLLWSYQNFVAVVNVKFPICCGASEHSSKLICSVGSQKVDFQRRFGFWSCALLCAVVQNFRFTTRVTARPLSVKPKAVGKTFALYCEWTELFITAQKYSLQFTVQVYDAYTKLIY